MNIERINAVADAIENHSISWLGFNMNYVMRTYNPEWDDPDYVLDMSGHNCETAGCIAGYTIALFDPDTLIRRDKSTSIFFGTQKAGELLDLERDVATCLFMPDHYDTPMEGIKPEQAVRVLRKLAKTGKVDWASELNEHRTGE